MTQPKYNNRLLQLMDDDDRAALGSIERVSLALHEYLEPTAAGPAYVFFMETGLASTVANGDGRIGVELGVTGHEGMVGLEVIYGDTGGPFQTFMQIEGSGYRADAGLLRTAISERPRLRSLMLAYARAFSIQVATTALANGRSKLDERLSRWLLMVSDRNGARFNITHEFISLMLAVRRSGVTLAIQILEGKRLIRASRGLIEIVDREGLIANSNGAYGLAEREYERLVGAWK